MKAIILISLLLTLGLQVNVTDTDKCSQCAEFKSQSDCENNGLGCEWKTSACGVKTITQPEIIKTYCEQVQEPGTKCTKTFGCAYVDQKCTHFTGCTAYVKTSLAECQAISGQCITNGVTCDDAKLCKDYTKEVCETTPGLLSPYKCKLDGETCRELKCTEADATLTTDDQCDEWQSGCVTTGQGCIDVLPNCNALTGTAETCLKMVGRDGKCILDSTSTTGACKLRVCSEASLTTYDNTTCGDYKTGCKSTGFSCVDALQGCSQYTGNQTSCLNFVGSDGKCAADSAATQCRARKCEDKLSGVLTDCTTYLDGCKTNGVSCVTTLQNCNQYKGTSATCAKIVGLDGNCKGTSTTDANASCAVKTCADDDTGRETTDAECQKIQSDCKTTGQGCAKTITTACNSYTDDGNCNKYVGSDGKCKAGAGGATPKCAARTCADNTTATTNTDCQNYKSGCVTNGAGCVAETTCVLTTLKAACASPRSSTTETCGWTDSCVQKSCTSFGSNQSLCENTKISDSNPCIWKNNTCQSALCSDYTSTEDAVCDSKKKGCVTNGTKCADPTVCSEFTGTMSSCRAYKAKCTNTSDSVAATTPCVDKACTDSDITASQDSDCENYLTGCVFAGNGKCISKTSGCSSYAGASTGDCENFTGYVSATADRVKCWWSATSLDTTKCVKKICTLATGMTDTPGCGGFLTGCVYDGNDSCVDEDAGCSSLKYKTNADECQSKTGALGTEKCWNGTGTNCKKRTCLDAPATSDYDSDGKCGIFLTGCVTTGAGCIASTSVCSSYSGTSVECAGFKGNSIPCLRKLACTRPIVSCTSKTDATSNKDCQTYSNTCVLTFGTTNCQDTQANCTGYALTGTTDSEKLTYCNSVKTSAGAFCAYDPATTETCVARTCALWSLSTKVTCTDYAGTGACTIGKNQQCFVIGACNSYTLPTSLRSAANKKTFCNNQWNTNGGLCTHDGTSTTCKDITTCEDVISPQNQDDCYDQSKQSNCVLIDSNCVTIKTSCTGYDISTITPANKSTLCSNLKSVSGSTITLCKYLAATTGTCVNATCEDIVLPTKQSDCNIVSGCHYYSSLCNTITSCTSYTFPPTVDDDTKKQAFCQNMYNTGGTEFCSYTATGGTTCEAPKLCTDYTPTGDDTAKTAECKLRRDKTGVICTFVAEGTTCSIPTATGENCTLITTGIAAHSDCDLKTTPNACTKNGSACAVSVACSQVPGANLAACEVVRDPNGFYCTWTTGGNCENGKNNCTNWSGSSAGDCSDKKDKYGNTCEWLTGATTCSNATTCEDAVSPKSQADCDLLGTGCIFYNASCIKNAAACTSYTFPSTVDDNPKKFTYCNGRVTTTGGVCTFTDASNNCVAAAGCSTYTAAGTPFGDKLTYCKSVLTTDNYGCVYSSGNNCQETADLCTSYTVVTAADCTSLKDTFGRSCASAASGLSCAYPACSTITSPTKQEDCDLVAAGCTYQNNKCVQLGACSSYTITGGSGATNYCDGLKDTNGVQCYATSDLASACTTRTCNDPATLYFTSNKECQDYSPLCKSDGVGCVDMTNDCTTLYGDSTSCSWFLDETGLGKCSAASPATVSASCDATTCEMNVTAQNQGECDSFIINGGCQWKNPGCYSKTVPCNQYRGTATECSLYVGNNVKCFGDSATRAACRDRTCADKTTAADTAECAAFMDNCIFNGVGCVAKTAPCSSFKGTNVTCKNFKAENDTKWCWSTSATQGNCVDRTCPHLQGLTDSECKAHFYDDSDCITNGTGCVLGPKTCSQFSGNDETCSKFTASDGPCKASSISTTAVACTPKVCYEAPNTYTTDKQCSDYHPSCETNGRGCQSSVNCTDISNKTSCAANTSCIWTSSCRPTSTTCSSLTSSGQSVCVNNPTQKCAWYTGGGNSANAKCRDYTCEDYDATLTTHEACMAASRNVCTTTGAGCVTYSTCSTYTKSACESATTTEKSKKCKWEGLTCRQQKCSDLTGATDEDCNGKLAGCKSNGTTCIGPNYDCSVFNGAEKFCLIDSTGQPCLYKEGTCYSYDNCTDITVTPTQTFCQKFSTNCVKGSTTCKALNQCSNYDKDSCLIGINNTTCGWLPTNACAEFKQCSSAAGTTWSDCAQWNSSCVSDGTACVPIGDCGSYLKALSCEGNVDTANNACFWTGTACRLKQCSDGTGVTDLECSNFIVKEGVCTTNGTSCVLRAACSSYSTETACTVGSDGIPCIYSFPVGTTTGTKSCRPKECTDILGTSNDQCVGQINNKKCVSNGKTCVNQGTCASYKNKVSCAAGGSDNPRCVFTAAPTTADPLAGTCQAFTSCASASGDSVTCLSNRSCKYTESTKKCETTDCKTFTPTGKCQPIPSFDAKTFTICTQSANGCTAGDPTSLAQTDCFSTISRYTYTWNASTSKCQSCKGTTSNPNNSNNGNTTNTTTDSGYVLGVSMALAILGFLA